MIVAATFVWADKNPAPIPSAPAVVVKGEVLEVKDVRVILPPLKTKDGETWAAVGKAPVRKGAEVTIENVMS